MKEIAALEPFEDSDIRSANLNIILLAENLDERSKAKLLALRTETDGFHVRGREIYWRRRKKPGTSLLGDCADREGTGHAIYHPWQEHDSKTGREVAVESLYNWRVRKRNMSAVNPFNR